MAFTLKFTDTSAFIASLDDTALPDGITVLIGDAGDGVPGWFYLATTSTAGLATGKVYATQSGSGRWVRVGLAATDIPGEVIIETTAPDPANPNGWSVHCQEVASPAYKITRVWNGSTWVVTSATPIHGEWGSIPPVDGAMPGHTATDYTNRVRYEWMDDLGTGYSWVNIGTF